MRKLEQDYSDQPGDMHGEEKDDFLSYVDRAHAEPNSGFYAALKAPIAADRKQAELDRLKDELTDLNLEYEMVESNLKKRTPEARRIESLQNEIQKVHKDMEVHLALY